MSSVYDILGLVGSLLTSAALGPQVYKAFRTKRVDDISLPFVCLFATGLVCVGVYGLGASLWPIYIPTCLELLGMLTLLTLKIRYQGRTPTTNADSANSSSSHIGVLSTHD